MAHVGEEEALGLVGGLCCLLGNPQLLPLLPMSGEVVPRAEEEALSVEIQVLGEQSGDEGTRVKTKLHKTKNPTSHGAKK